MKISKNFFPVFLFLLVCFPYVTLISFGSDTQPYSLLFSVLIFIILAMKNKTVMMPHVMFYFFIIVFYAMFIMLVRGYTGASLRSLVGYASTFFICYAAYNTFKYVKSKWLIRTIYVWFTVGVVQYFINRTFAGSILSRMNSTDERGVTSLGVEPSYYAAICIFFLIILDVFYQGRHLSKKKYLFTALLLVVQIFVFSKSGLGLMMLAVYFASKLVAIALTLRIHKQIPLVILIVAVIAAGTLVFKTNDQIKQSRSGILVNYVLEDPASVLLIDASTADRATHIVLPLQSVFNNYGVGYGLGQWQNNFSTLVGEASPFVANMARFSSLEGTRIMSGWGSAWFELGIFGLIFTFSFIWVFFVGFKNNPRYNSIFVSSGLTIFVLMLMAIPLALPLFGYTLGVFMYLSYREKYDREVFEHPGISHATSQNSLAQHNLKAI